MILKIYVERSDNGFYHATASPCNFKKETRTYVMNEHIRILVELWLFVIFIKQEFSVILRKWYTDATIIRRTFSFCGRAHQVLYGIGHRNLLVGVFVDILFRVDVGIIELSLLHYFCCVQFLNA